MAMLVFITDTAMKVPIKYDPLSPRNILDVGKLYFRNVITIKNTLSIKKAKSLLPWNKFIKNKFSKIIKVWIVNNPLYPSIRLLPFIMNKKHKHIKNNAKISIVKNLFNNLIPVFSI